MKALITAKALLTVEPGSIVEISESQFKALGYKAIAYKEEAKAAEEPVSFEVPDIQQEHEEAPEDPVPEEETLRIAKKTSRRRRKNSED